MQGAKKLGERNKNSRDRIKFHKLAVHTQHRQTDSRVNDGTTGLNQKPPPPLLPLQPLLLTSLDGGHGGWSRHNNKAQAVLDEQENDQEDEE